ncbi:chitin disaccharide deacetylase [Clostridium paraputrificum]|uniref:chitin disaccharide deacetylase n=1 Tax=Clostridium TaxID=1485 RepID=UPI003D3304DD
MKLIINGDDFGITEGVSKGIIKAIKDGVMTDTTAMANMPYFDEAIELAKAEGINVGIHLTITCGRPVLPTEEVKNIVDENGEFFKKPNPRLMNPKDVEKELRAQLDKFIKTGMKLSHIDGHHHFYVFHPEVFKIVVRLAKEYNVPIRCPRTETINALCTGYNFPLVKEDVISMTRGEGVSCPDNFAVDFYEDGVSEESLINIIKESLGKYDVLEIMSHPAFVDEDLRKISSYNTLREEELKILTSDKVKKFIVDNNIELISFSDL